MWVSLKS